MSNTANSVIWIIGASSGIGCALAKEYAQRGHKVIISARNQHAIDVIAQQDIYISALALDITDQTSLQNAYDYLTENHSAIDKIIINAGICEYIDSVDIDTDSVSRVMETNFIGAVNVSKIALPILRSNPDKRTQLVFVSSSVTYQALTRAGAYGSSKAALSYFAESLRLDVQHEGIDVRIVSPGFVQTPLTDKNDFPMPFRITAEDAAKRIVRGLKGGAFDIHFPKRFTYILKMLHCLPTSVRHWLLGKTSRHMEDLQEMREAK